jgi:calcineurin-like phosphoesterase family protein
MELKSITLIQVGDIHFPESRDESVADKKDSSFPKAVADMAAMRPLTCVSRALTRELDQKPNALLFSGDMTTKGNVDGYRECLEYLNRVVNFARWKPNKIHAVPGNHDVDRKMVDPTGKDLYAKFTPFELLWESYDLPILTVSKIRSTKISSGSNSVFVHSLNSSLGCGEKRYLPPEIAPDLIKLFDDYAKRVGDDAFALLGDTLDTPAFNHSDIEDICQAITVSESKHLPLVLSHHNILPQVLPRLAMYTELINAGVIRSRFSHLERPIIYCHGHIHDHPLEVIHEPEYEGSRVICVSAPAFTDGFNVVRVEFTSQGFPVGCVVTSHRLSPRDCEVRRHAVRIPLISGSFDIRRIADPRITRLVGCMVEKETRLADVIETLNDSTMSPSVAAALALEAEWLGLIAIEDRDNKDPGSWVLRRR